MKDLLTDETRWLPSLRALLFCAVIVVLAASLASTGGFNPPRAYSPPRSEPPPPSPVPASTVTYPFTPPPQLRRPGSEDELPSLFSDAAPCASGCRPQGAVDAWPLYPFDRQHPLRAALNERRDSGFHVGLDIQTKDNAGVYALQPGEAKILQASGPDTRVQVGNYIYWHIHPLVRSGQHVDPLRQRVGTVMPGFGHLHLSEVDATGKYLNPLRPGGRVLSPWTDTDPPVLGQPHLDGNGKVTVPAFDPQSFQAETTYRTPVLAPAGLAYRLFDAQGHAIGPLQWALRGTTHMPDRQASEVFASDAHSPGFDCFAAKELCIPDWTYRLAGGLAPSLPLDLAPGNYRLSIYAWDWADNKSALDADVAFQDGQWRYLGLERGGPLPPSQAATASLPGPGY